MEVKGLVSNSPIIQYYRNPLGVTFILLNYKLMVRGEIYVENYLDLRF